MSGENQCCGNCQYGAPYTVGFVSCTAPIPKSIYSATHRFQMTTNSGRDCDCWRPYADPTFPNAPKVTQ